ncbi:hypothetical protein FPF71_08905 [Algibacter amylolyticus]|uniref:Exo-alpha-sialidase n=1 Tax=Algibacter amylolyticus TaxID=1608400 RepID=A0A5M7B805_9FLAO|nr:hypothetical protein [Algibacter amylolyticus]KAA5824790.1 hypothetical protein F2B50_08905 [Algibacter amylolyticus]MBB5268907.1 photosystem II stability/assembly factor-like uncharacterized protein [Algibacter amylolyticus]TSJ75955.1 hypothetical protein FPF71_08905 [Algibacter amylolyticus]
MKTKLIKIKQVFFVIFITSSLFSSCQEKNFIETEQEVIDNETPTNNNPDEEILNTDISVINFEQGGPVGGGYPNVVTWDPNEAGKIYFGSDIGGTGKSTNYGKDFESSARGLGYEDSHQKIAALNAIDVNGSTIIVGGTGFKGAGGEVISSSNGGETWSHDSSDISFSAQNSNAPLPTGRPRSTDPSLIQWVSGATWVAGTYKDGVWISTNNRNSWTRLKVFNGDVFVRAMAMSPDDVNTVYVGLWGDNSSIENKGLWRISNLDSSPQATKVSGIPDVVESITVLGNRLYLACGKFGVRRFVPSNNNLSDITGNIGNTVMSTAIHGVERSWNTDRVVVGTAEGNGDIWVSEDSGSSWTNTTASGVSFNPWGSNENLIVFEKHGNWALGGAKCDVATIQISPHNPDAWVVCSTSAIWTTDNAGSSWRPANGFQILTYRDVEISKTGVIAVANVDHDVLLSTDQGSKWTAIGLQSVTTGNGLKFSPNGEELAFAVNERDNNTSDGKFGIASSPNTPLSPEIKEISNTASPKRIIGSSWVHLPNKTERIIVAIDDGGVRTIDRSNGYWSNWTIRSNAFMGAQINNGLRCAVETDGASITFIYDRQTGVWRTTDYGETWSQILTTTAGSDQGYLAYDSANDNLYVSTPNEVILLKNASTEISTYNLSFPTSKPGALALDSVGRLLVYAEPLIAGNFDCALYCNSNPSTDKNMWVDVADETFKRVAPPVTDIDILENQVVLTTSGKGLLVSKSYPN